MPKLWNDTVDEHRTAVRNATLDAAARIAQRDGLASMSMSEIAKEAGIGRATLYKYFADVQAVLGAWHERHVAAHLQEFHSIAHGSASARESLRLILVNYAETNFRHHGSEIAAMLHSGAHAVEARQHLTGVLTHLIEAAASAGDIRRDMMASELATFCLSAVEGATNLKSKDAVGRLVGLTLSALKP
jgi:AcrR family transcriptional regulator